MAPASIGPVKAMILSLNVEKITDCVEGLIKEGSKDVRLQLQQFAEKEDVEIDS
jgi:phosphotransferase system enzyme I (PtsP)